ncbi:P-loop containing nucleoside triphosphate hydrolase protein [Talaromyces proteolyticus]|uniref:P-loop containing nucleoside triphosphate hydrolase protein n=1 Tax=Talaromyces proteolyticus TaxID=1131652 RepID=A0AAD4KYP9_9EURO|nr:P-loop containing nucleoside triphosphate hydrolase protein [Talaromyces proteolyticus]KAH8700275.1 P-loop containing nucleoside triphosphate hydrolase protein [Talaromyces proteolyticus]
MTEDKASSQLQSQQGGLLDKIDELRNIGVGGIVELPQLIVCGSQSSGKSSVLEAISRVQFPAKGSVCTRFATEVVLRRSPTPNIKISIEPGPSRQSKQERDRLRDFRPGAFHDGKDLPPLIEKAKECMGIDEADHMGFSDDVLRVEISGPDKPELTLVDLPGLYSSTSQDQSKEGISMVRSLTERYMRNSRSIILAVISAKMDYHLQEILDLAEKFDPGRERTLAIITKPDSLEERSEDEDIYLQFMQNKKVHLKQGWHALHNRSHKTRGTSDDARDRLEKEFFERGRWASISRSFVGIDSLRHRLSHILLNHIEENLPQMLSEIEEKINERKQELSKLGESRSNIRQQKGFLHNISRTFDHITADALLGRYTDPFFGDEMEYSRLRAVIRELNEQFVDAMSIGGSRRIIVNKGEKERIELDRDNARYNGYLKDWSANYISRDDLEIEVAESARMNRGIELPGTANQHQVGRLFRDQSNPWEELARTHITEAWGAVKCFVMLVLQHLTDKHTCSLIFVKVLEPKLETMKNAVLDKLEELTSHIKRGHPLPVGREFLIRLQKARSIRESPQLYEQLKAAGVQEDQRLVFDQTSLKKVCSQVQTSGDEFAATDIIDQMVAYYDTAIVTFVDNVVTLGIENCLLNPLKSIFTGQTINEMDDSEVQALAAEPIFVQKEREHLSRELEKLDIGRRTLAPFARTARSHPLRPAFDKNGSDFLPSSGGQSPFQPPVNGKPSETGGSAGTKGLFNQQNGTPVKSNEKTPPSTLFSRSYGSPNPSDTNGIFSFNIKPVGTSEPVPFFGNGIYPPPTRTSTVTSDL